MITISVDAMGGDHGPTVIIPALMKVVTRRPDIRFLIYGRADEVSPVLEKFPKVAAVSEFTHCDISVRMDDKPSQALRHGRWKSSMWKAIEAVKAGQAEACISAGNTGALMAMSRFCLRTMATIDRPAIAAIWPTLRGESVVLDVGATIGADAISDRFRDSRLGHVAGAVRHRPADRGAAQCRRRGDQGPGGGQGSRSSAARSRHDVDELPRFRRGRRSREGDRRCRRHRRLRRQHRAEDSRGHRPTDRLLSEVGDEPHPDVAHRLFLRQGSLRHAAREDGRAQGQWRRLLGLNGIVVKSHGGTDDEGFAAAVELGYDMVRNRLLDRIEADLDLFHARHPQPAATRAPSEQSE